MGGLTASVQPPAGSRAMMDRYNSFTASGCQNRPDPAGRLQRGVSPLACILDTGGPSGYTLNTRFNIEYLAIGL
jgi:hypothetical protein